MTSNLSLPMRSLRINSASVSRITSSCNCSKQQLRSFHQSPSASLYGSQQRLPETKKFVRRGWQPSPTRSPPLATTSQTGLPLTNLPYYVRRTAANQLPVYTDTKAGGTLQQTKIQKVEGNIEALKDHLACDLGVDPKSKQDISINPLTGHIVVKGWRRPQIQKFLIERGF